jgi:CBS domain-containing protein
MRPLDALRTVAPDTPAAEAFTTMARDDVNQLPVVADGRLEGVVTRTQILQLLQSRSELHA